MHGLLHGVNNLQIPAPFEKRAELNQLSLHPVSLTMSHDWIQGEAELTFKRQKSSFPVAEIVRDSSDVAPSITQKF